MRAEGNAPLLQPPPAVEYPNRGRRAAQGTQRDVGKSCTWRSSALPPAEQMFLHLTYLSGRKTVTRAAAAALSRFCSPQWQPKVVGASQRASQFSVVAQSRKIIVTAPSSALFQSNLPPTVEKQRGVAWGWAARGGSCQSRLEMSSACALPENDEEHPHHFNCTQLYIYFSFSYLFPKHSMTHGMTLLGLASQPRKELNEILWIWGQNTPHVELFRALI